MIKKVIIITTTVFLVIIVLQCNANIITNTSNNKAKNQVISEENVRIKNLINGYMTIEQKQNAFKEALILYNNKQAQAMINIIDEIPTEIINTDIETSYILAIQHAQQKGYTNINCSEHDRMVLKKIQKYNMKKMSTEEKKQQLHQLLIAHCAYSKYDIDEIVGNIKWQNIDNDFPEIFYSIIYSYPNTRDFTVYARYAHDKNALTKIYNKIPTSIVDRLRINGYEIGYLDICPEFYNIVDNYTEDFIKYLNYPGTYKRTSAIKAGLIVNDTIAKNYITIICLNKANNNDDLKLLSLIDWTKSDITIEILSKLYRAKIYSNKDIEAIFNSDYNDGVYNVYEKYITNDKSASNLSKFNKLMKDLIYKRYNKQIKETVKNIPEAGYEFNKFMINSLFKDDWN